MEAGVLFLMDSCGSIPSGMSGNIGVWLGIWESGDLGDNARSALWWLSQQLNNCYGNEIVSDGSRIIFWHENEEKTHDQKILYVANQVKNDRFHFNDDVIVLTKSVALRAKARNNGISAEDYDDVGFIEEIDGWRRMPITADEMERILRDRELKTFHLDGRENLARMSISSVRARGSRATE